MERKLPTGTLRMHSEGGINTQVGRGTVAEITQMLNTSEYLTNRFFNPDHPRTLFFHNFPDNSAVTITDQTGKYADVSLMVIARGTDAPSANSERTPTETIYQYPEHTQKLYWKSIFTAMHTLRDEASLPADTRVIATENCIATYSNEQHRTSRSIRYPHAQILALPENHIEPTEASIQHLDEERKIATRVLPGLATDIQAGIPDPLKQNTHFSLRQEIPHGYTIIVPQSLEHLQEDPSEIANLMSAHHHAYERAINKHIPEEHLIPQPSYRLYLEHVHDKLFISISPEFNSHAGVMEAAGILLHRDESHPKRFSDEEVRSIQNKAIEKIVFLDKNLSK